MNRFILPLGLFALLAVVLGIGIKHSPDKGTIASVLIGKPAPQFSMRARGSLSSAIPTRPSPSIARAAQPSTMACTARRRPFW